MIFLPIIYYTPETKIAGGMGGVYYFRTPEDNGVKRPSSILMDFVYTQKKQLMIEFFPDIYLKRGEYHLISNLSYKKYCDKFYGIGNTTSKDQEENYSFRVSRIDLTFQKKVYKQFYLGLQYEFEYNEIIEVEEEGELIKKEITGSRGGLASGVGLIFNWDSRDNIFYPTGGRFCQIAVKFFGRALGSSYDFQRFNLDFRQYFPIFSHALAFQLYINIINGNPPFQMLSMLGGQNLMRGYYKGRYRDKNMVALQMEYRMPLWWRFGLVGFLGIGDVAGRISDFRFKDFKNSGGLGIRWQISREQGANLRIDFGLSSQSSGFYMTVNEAF